MAVNGAINDPAAANNTPKSQPHNDMAAFKAKIEKLTMMKDAGLITEDEFGNMKAKLLSEIL